MIDLFSDGGINTDRLDHMARTHLALSRIELCGEEQSCSDLINFSH
jgi:hypothetical protein